MSLFSFPDGVGHSPQVEAPKKTLQLIEDFLK
jgi:pimeloyl-ACP methyl ester carboxylesterase